MDHSCFFLNLLNQIEFVVTVQALDNSGATHGDDVNVTSTITVYTGSNQLSDDQVLQFFAINATFIKNYTVSERRKKLGPMFMTVVGTVLKFGQFYKFCQNSTKSGQNSNTVHWYPL